MSKFSARIPLTGALLIKASRVALLALCICVLAPLQSPAADYGIFKRFALDGSEELLQTEGVTFDKEVTADGAGSVRIVSQGPGIVNLLRLKEPDLENCRLIYEATVKTKDFKGSVYLIMWLTFEGKGEYFSKGLNDRIANESDWKKIRTPFFLQKGQNPDGILLGIAVNGKGTVWIDSIELSKSPL